MPVHDWTLVNSGLFHAFHQSWCVHIQDFLNSGGLPPDYMALVEQRIKGPIADVLTLRLPRGKRKPKKDSGGIAIAAAPEARVVRRTNNNVYANRGSRISVRHQHGDVVAVIEIVSPGNKATAAECRMFVTKAADLIVQGVNLLVIDLFPPGKHDPLRLHEAIWEEIAGDDNEEGESTGELPNDEPLTLAAYDAGPEKVTYVESLAIGHSLPAMPIFLQPEQCVMLPLEPAYETTWRLFPDSLKDLLESAK